MLIYLTRERLDPIVLRQLSYLAFKWKWGWCWPCYDTDLTAFLIKILTQKHHEHKKRREVCTITRSTPPSLSFKVQVAKHTTVKWSIRSVSCQKKKTTLETVFESFRMQNGVKVGPYTGKGTKETHTNPFPGLHNTWTKSSEAMILAVMWPWSESVHTYPDTLDNQLF